MKKLLFSYLATVLFAFTGNAQNDAIKLNLEKQIKSTLENYVLINQYLNKSPNLSFDETFFDEIKNINNDIEMLNILSKNGVIEAQNILNILNIENKNIQYFYNKNKDFFALDDTKKEIILNEVFESIYASYDSRLGITIGEPMPGSCYSDYQKAYNRCNRNFAVAGTGAVLTAGFNPIAGLIVGGVACANLYNCRNDAYEDYQDCIKN